MKMEWTFILGVVCQVVSSHELIVRSNDLQRCGEHPVCVTNLEDCHPLPGGLDSPIQVNLSCFYEQSEPVRGQVICELCPAAATESSLLITSSSGLVSCGGLLRSRGKVQVTVRVHDQRTGAVRWSAPRPLKLALIVRGSRPAVLLSGVSSSSMALSWTPGQGGRCWVRYSPEPGAGGPQEEGQVEVEAERPAVHTLRGLLPSTRYTAQVACKPASGSLSRWSEEVRGQTLQRAPSAAPDACYRLEGPPRGPGAPLLLWLTWKEMDVREAGGRVHGYQVSYRSPTDGRPAALNVTRPAAALEVGGGRCRVRLAAFNPAGFGPDRIIDVEPLQPPLRPPRRLWALSLYPNTAGFLVQWEADAAPQAPPTASGPPAHRGHRSPAPPGGVFAVEWRAEGVGAVRGWTRVNASSLVIQGGLALGRAYSVSVHAMRGAQCGPARSLSASLLHGALLEAVNLRAVGQNATSVTAQWAWQQKTEPIRVERYRVVLRCHCGEDRALLLFPDQSQHTFENLLPNTQYSLLLLADNTTRESHVLSTLRVSTATPVSILILLGVTVLSCCLCRAFYKYYFTLRICSPRKSSTGLWLMGTHQQALVRNILNMEDFLGDFRPVEVSPPGAGEAGRPASHARRPAHQDYVAAAAPSAYAYANAGVLRQGAQHVADSPVAVEALLQEMRHVVQPPCRPAGGHRFPPGGAEATWELGGSSQSLEGLGGCRGDGAGPSGAPLIVCERDYVLSSSFFQAGPPGGPGARGAAGARQ